MPVVPEGGFFVIADTSNIEVRAAVAAAVRR